MGRRRRRVMRIPKKKLPKIFLCPKCGREAIKIEMLKNQKSACIRCGICGFTEEVALGSSLEEVDVYCDFIDRYYKQV